MRRNGLALTSMALLCFAIAVRAEPPCPQRSAAGNLYWGDLHVHSAFSFDAYAWNLRLGPADAYRFAKGEPIELVAPGADGSGGRVRQLERPIDFAAVTDHAELMGELAVCTDPASDAFDTELCQFTRGEGGLAGFAAWSASSALGPYLIAPVAGWIYGSFAARAFADPGIAAALRITKWLPVKNAALPRSVEVCGPEGERCRDATAGVWAATQRAANEANEPCVFTAFNAYEYSGAPGGSNLHRNVIFRSAEVPALPTSFVEAKRADLLWQRLEETCLDAGTGCDALAIPHNPNRSNGRLLGPEYAGKTGLAEQARLAALRQRLEPLVEISQHKGDSECRNGMWGVLGSEDELCDYEKFRLIGKTPDEVGAARGRDGFIENSSASAADCGSEPGSGGFGGCGHRLDYVRYALVEGLAEAERLGVNPLKLGIIASSDAHNANPGDVEEASFGGHFGFQDGTPELRLTPNRPPGGIESNPGGLVAVWAPENTRAALFDAMRRREAYGTSGPRMQVRFHGGWESNHGACTAPTPASQAHTGSVPMGSDLPPSTSSGPPNFSVWATRDPGSENHPGTALERIQIIKGTTGPDGAIEQQVYDVVTTDNTAPALDIGTCEPPPGSDVLCTQWTDPDFDPSQHAVYYARVIERPSCRYSWLDCRRQSEEDRAESCDDPTIPRSIRERAWTSPIWYTPDRSSQTPRRKPF